MHIHASAAALGHRGVLITGPSGSGKSDLLIRLIDAGAVLIGDDQIIIQKQGNGLAICAPEILQGLVEIRGMGIVRMPSTKTVPLHLVISLHSTPVPRLPEQGLATYLGVTVPSITLDPFSASAVARVRAAVTYERVDA